MTTTTQELKQTRRSPLVVVSNAAGYAEKSRVMAQVRLAHLAIRGRTCATTEQLLEKALEYENWVDAQLKGLVKEHPAYHWFSRIPGVSAGEVIGKVLGELESFGHYYDERDPKIPGFVTREPEEYIVLDKDRSPQTRVGVWVEAIERWPTPSAMRKYGGLTPAAKRRAGQVVGFNTALRTMWFRLMVNCNRQGNKYHDFYTQYKAYLHSRFEEDGIKVLPTPKVRMCPACEKEMKVPKDTLYCPDCGTKLALKNEPPGVLWQGHVHSMCMRREAQLFNDHLWLIWREALGLPLRTPYPAEKQGHTTMLSPWDMVD